MVPPADRPMTQFPDPTTTMKQLVLALFLVLCVAQGSRACDCAMELPGTLCETMDPAWIEPDIVVLGVKIDEVYYGMHVRILQVFQGTVAEGDTITVWGDNGALCRWYVGTWTVGDTVVWGFNNTDFLGNEITAGFPPDLEQPGDYHISYCGTYWLGYADGVVTGGIAPGVSSSPIGEFWAAVSACLSTGALEQVIEPSFMSISLIPGGVRLSATRQTAMHLEVMDTRGRSLVRRDWNGGPMAIDGLRTGAYLVRVSRGEERWTRRFVVAQGD